MVKHLNFEKDLPHQKEAVDVILKVFDGVSINYGKDSYANPLITYEKSLIEKNIKEQREKVKLSSVPKKYKKIFKEGEEEEPLILDIHMETGTGKTYTYVKTIFELNKEKGINKFVIVVPTLSIKAGTVNFLNSESAKRHFRDIYNKQINCLIVESESKKSNKKTFPTSIKEFVNSDFLDKNYIQVLVINQGMINSKTILEDKYDVTIFDKYSNCVDGISATTPIIIIDEPHKFKADKVTWGNILKFKPQIIIRYGATFDNHFYDLIYSLDSIKSFNDDLIKGIVVEVEEVENGKNEKITLKSATSKEAVFSYVDELGKSKDFIVGKGENLHSTIIGITVDEMNTKRVQLSNGYEMKIKDSINPVSYSESMQEKIMKDAIAKHFELEEKYMKDLSPRIKPMTLFFIDNIESYRNENKDEETLRIYFEKILENFLKEKINKFEKEGYNGEYKKYLEKSLRDISMCHGGYFSKDNSDKDEKIEKEINEILHDKESLLDIENPRRFIFSKWTLREGWDNPNIFVICKLRGSGSETNKLQEVGRGLRIPVNEYMNRVTGKEHYLHYFVDFTEKDFVGKLIGEINAGKIVKQDIGELSEKLLEEIAKIENKSSDEIFDELRDAQIIDRKLQFLGNGYSQLIEKYPVLFEELKPIKITSAKDEKNKKYVHIRKENYEIFKKLWEELNSKVIIKYDFNDNGELQDILNKMILTVDFEDNGIKLKSHTIQKGEEVTSVAEEALATYEIQELTLAYKDFLLELEKLMNIPLNMLHKMFIYLNENKVIEINNGITKRIDINRYLNKKTIRKIKSEYIKYMIENSYTQMKVGYEKLNAEIHPTKLTDQHGNVLSQALASDFGILTTSGVASKNYLYDEIFFDSDIEKENIEIPIKEVTVFAKIPKNSIKIPVIGGGTYSPDFAYIIKRGDGKEELNLIIESKGKEFLNEDEEMKINCAEILFKNYLGRNINLKFKKQLKNDAIYGIVREFLEK